MHYNECIVLYEGLWGRFTVLFNLPISHWGLIRPSYFTLRCWRLWAVWSGLFRGNVSRERKGRSPMLGQWWVDVFNVGHTLNRCWLNSWCVVQLPQSSWMVQLSQREAWPLPTKTLLDPLPCWTEFSSKSFRVHPRARPISVQRWSNFKYVLPPFSQPQVDEGRFSQLMITSSQEKRWITVDSMLVQHLLRWTSIRAAVSQQGVYVPRVIRCIMDICIVFSYIMRAWISLRRISHDRIIAAQPAWSWWMLFGFVSWWHMRWYNASFHHEIRTVGI